MPDPPLLDDPIEASLIAAGERWRSIQRPPATMRSPARAKRPAAWALATAAAVLLGAWFVTHRPTSNTHINLTRPGTTAAGGSPECGPGALALVTSLPPD